MLEEESLRQWVAFYHQQHPGRITYTLHQLLQISFPQIFKEIAARQEDEWDIILQILDIFYEAPLKIDKTQLPVATLSEPSATNTEFHRLLEFMIGAVVQSEEKATFVRDILTMQDAVQVDLMEIIERVMTHGATGATVATTIDEEVTHNREESSSKPDAHQESTLSTLPVHRHEMVEQYHLSDSRSPMHLARNAELERAKRENDILKDENIHITREMEDMQRKLKAAEMENGTLVETIQQLKLQLEVDVLKKERAVRHIYDERILALERDLNATTAELHTKNAVANEVVELRDEVDLLRPMADKVAKMEATVAKYRVKIDELTSAKEKLRRVEETNTELMEKNLALETQLTKAASLQRKLNEAKEANTTVEFRVSELEALLSRQKQELVRVRSDWEASQNALHEARDLNAQLQETVNQQRNSSDNQNINAFDGSVMAGGISEFNPELMQKMARLEYENQELKKQVDGETFDKIDSLLDQIDDLTRLKRSFEGRYFDMERQYEATSNELAQVKQSLIEEKKGGEILQAELQHMTGNRDQLALELQNLSDLKKQLEETVDTLHHQVADRDVDLVFQQNALAALSSTFEHETKEKRKLQESLRRQIECTTMQVEDAEALRMHLYQQKDHALNTLSQKYKLIIENACAEREQMIEEHRAIVLDLETDKNACITRMTEVIDAKSAKIEQLLMEIQDYKETYSRQLEELDKKHAREQQRLEHLKQDAENELRAYKELHSVSNADWKEKESLLRTKVEHLVQSLNEEELKFKKITDTLNEEIQKLMEMNKEMQARFDSQECGLKETIKSQLAANQELVTANQTLKSDVKKKQITIIKLDHAITRLESKVVLLEKERAHFTNLEERKRDVENDEATASQQFSTQLGLVVAELDKLHKDHKELQRNLSQCRCSSSDSEARALASSNDAKNYYLSRIHQLEDIKRQEEEKRRELLLVNAKHIQEQKQLQVKNTALTQEVQQLKERMNSWLIREERRKREESQMREKLPDLEKNVGILTQRHAETSPLLTHNDTKKVDERTTDIEYPDPNSRTRQPETDQRQRSPGNVKKRSLQFPTKEDVSSGQENLPPVNTPGRETTESRGITPKKRKMDAAEDDSMVKKTADDVHEPIEAATESFVDGASFFSSLDATKNISNTTPLTTTAAQSRTKRRMSVFIANRLKSQPDFHEEKPSECQQQ